jgi:hypothetical protein
MAVHKLLDSEKLTHRAEELRKALDGLLTTALSPDGVNPTTLLSDVSALASYLQPRATLEELVPRAWLDFLREPSCDSALAAALAAAERDGNGPGTSALQVGVDAC